MRDKKKFYVPKHIKYPLPGDYEVTLNWGDKVYVDKNEFERKTSKYFKNYLVVEDELENTRNYSQDYFTIVSLEDNNEIGFTSWTGGQSIPMATPYKVTIDVSIDNGQTWLLYVSSFTRSIIATLNTGDKVLIKGSNYSYANSSTPVFRNHFDSTKNINVEGNIMSLLYKDDFINEQIISSNYAFMGLFENCSNLISAKNLIFPATTLTKGCYENMFTKCTSLITAPSILPSTTLAESCYSQMFSNCTSLTTAPQLPATTLQGNCYSNMFSNCTSLNNITCLATDNFMSTLNWVKNIAASGIFVKAFGVVWETGVNGIPEGWTVKDI